jgi:hypothetical protein
MGVALVIALIAFPLVALQLASGRIHVRGGIIRRGDDPHLFWIVGAFEMAVAAGLVVAAAIYFK